MYNESTEKYFHNLILGAKLRKRGDAKLQGLRWIPPCQPAASARHPDSKAGCLIHIGSEAVLVSCTLESLSQSGCAKRRQGW